MLLKSKKYFLLIQVILLLGKIQISYAEQQFEKIRIGSTEPKKLPHFTLISPNLKKNFSTSEKIEVNSYNRIFDSTYRNILYRNSKDLGQQIGPWMQNDIQVSRFQDQTIKNLSFTANVFEKAKFNRDKIFSLVGKANSYNNIQIEDESIIKNFIISSIKSNFHIENAPPVQTAANNISNVAPIQTTAGNFTTRNSKIVSTAQNINISPIDKNIFNHNRLNEQINNTSYVNFVSSGMAMPNYNPNDEMQKIIVGNNDMKNALSDIANNSQRLPAKPLQNSQGLPAKPLQNSVPTSAIHTANSIPSDKMIDNKEVSNKQNFSSIQSVDARSAESKTPSVDTRPAESKTPSVDTRPAESKPKNDITFKKIQPVEENASYSSEELQQMYTDTMYNHNNEFKQITSQIKPQFVSPKITEKTISNVTLDETPGTNLNDTQINNLIDPMKRNINQTSQAMVIAEMNLSIQTIMEENGKMICYINDEEFKEGDSVLGYKIKKIMLDGVIVTDKQGLDKKIDF